MKDVDVEHLTDLPMASSRDGWAALRRAAWKHPGKLAVTILGYAAGVAAGTSIPRMVGSLTDSVRAGQSFHDLLPTIWLMCGLAVVYGFAAFSASMASGHLGTVLGRDIRNDFLRHTAKAPLGLLERTGTGRLIGRVTQDISVMAAFYSWSFFVVFNNAVIVTVVAIQILLFTGWLGLLVVPCALFIWLRLRTYLKKSHTAYRRTQATKAHVQAVATETISASFTVDALNLGHTRLRKTVDANRRVYLAERAAMANRLTALPWIISTPFFLAVTGIGLAAYLVPTGHATVGEAVTFTTLVAIVYPPLRTFSYVLDEWQVADVSLARLIGVNSLTEAAEQTHAMPTEAVQASGDSIELKNVHFAYRKDVPVLRDINLTIASGERVTIVGPSGSGKSTLARLISGLSAPSAGQVTIDDTPIAAIPAVVLRDHVALLTQEQHVFAMSLADNLRLGAPNANEDEIRQSLDAVAATPWVNALPNGLDTMVGESGVDIDPAKAQQLALARVLLINPHTVILDEATSLLDPDSARDVELALSRLLEGRTVITIAHQLHSARTADVVLYMRDGRVAERGTHDELMAKGGQYAELFTAWEARR